jgi:hypothetical protein
MKNRRTGCVIVTIFVLVGGILVAGLVAYYMLVIVPNTLEDRRITSGPPSVLAYSPDVGDTFPAGVTAFARATVSGRNPISRVELWLDGELITTLMPESSDQQVYQAFAGFLISEGSHLLSWRAIDNAGLVGQSMPTAIAGVSIPVAAEPAGQDAPEDANPPGDQDQQNQGGGEAPGGNVQGNQAGPENAPPGDDGAQQEKLGPGNEPPPEAWIAHEVTNIDWSRFFKVTSTLYPKAPSNLKVGFDNCRVNLLWTDNADNETYFNVWIQALGGPPVPVKELGPRDGTGQAWYSFDAPPFGIYSVWVEAVNALGGQASEIGGVAVNRNCTEGVPTHLEIEALSMNIFNEAWENIYCYVSLEGAPEERIPESGFLELDPVHGADIHTWFGGRNRRLVPIPDDEVITIEGKCMGWLGDNPQAMGFINESVPKADWDGRTLKISGPNFSVDYRIRTHVFSGGEGAYEYVDESITVPIITAIEVAEGNTPDVKAFYAKYPKIIFAWEGNTNITGFTLYINGAPQFHEITPAPFSAFHKIQAGPLPTQCGGTYQFKVAANSENVRSDFSSVMVYEQPPCERYAKLSFDGFLFAWLGGETASDCTDTLLRVRIYDPFGGAQLVPIPKIECNKKYEFISSPNRVQHIGMDAGGGTVNATVNFSERVYVWLSEDPLYLPICSISQDYPIPPMSDEDWSTFKIQKEVRCPDRPMDHNGSGRIYLSITGYIGAK